MTINSCKGWSGDSDFAPVQTMQSKLPSGSYTAWTDHNGITRFSLRETMTDKALALPGLPTKFILDQIKLFWSKKDEYARYNFLQKRGILMYGPPGCGKSCIIALLRQELIAIGGVVLDVNDFTIAQRALAALRLIEPDRPLMTVFEDVETKLESSNGSNVGDREQALLSILDGAEQVNNVVHVATTNKPDVLADRFIRRPGRFDLIVGVFSPTAETREAYLKAVCNGNISSADLKKLVDKTEGLSLAFLREIASTYLVLGIPIDETLCRITDHAKGKFKKDRSLGFKLGFDTDSSELAI